MKVLLLLFFIGINTVFAESYSQKTRLSLHLKDVTIEDLFTEIEKNSEYIFMYKEDVPTKSKVSVEVENETLDKILNQILNSKDINYFINGRQVILSRKAPSLPSNPYLQQHTNPVSGLVTDGEGNPIIGATVSIAGTTTGIITDIDGKYTLNAKEGDKLVFSYLGYNTEERIVKKEAIINVRMMEANIGLEDIVVIGYGQQKKSSVVASVNTISAKELSVPSRSLTNSIAGQIAGVMAIQRTGEPGHDDAQFWIRGVSSFAGGTNPLVLVDGVPRKMNDIGIDEIESFTVLKDAAATAVYGSEGANGVVLITSKRGTVQKTTMDIRAEYSIVAPTRLPDLMDSYNYLKMYNEAVWNDAGNPTSNFSYPYSDAILEKYRTGVDTDLYPNVNWMDMMRSHTENSRFTINFRGGNEKAKYFVSGAYYQENGIFDSKALDDYSSNIGLKRYNLRSNIDIELTKTTSLRTDISGQYLTTQGPRIGTQRIFTTLSYFPTYLIPMRYSDGTFSEHPRYSGERSNPYNLLNESGYQKEWGAFLQTRVGLEQKLDFLLPGLYIKADISFDAEYTSTTVRSKDPLTKYAKGRDEDGNLIYETISTGHPDLSNPEDTGKSGKRKIYTEASVNYKNTFNKLHDVTGILLVMAKEEKLQNNELAYRKQSFVARATYGYDNRYMMEGSFGMTGSENFAKGHRYGIFPAVGVAWYMSNEAFMKNIEETINKLKFRFSYGKTGNDFLGADQGRFPYRGSLEMGGAGYNFGFNPGANGGGTNSPGSGITEKMFASPFLTWEIEYKKNIGLDMGLLGGRIDLTVDGFSNKRSSILLKRRTVSNVTGFREFPFQNFGIVTNKGFDGSLVVKQNIADFAVTLRGNITYARNKIIEYDEIKPVYDYQAITGGSLQKPYIYLTEGLYTDNDFDIDVNPDTGGKTYTLKEGMPNPGATVMPGDIKYKDLNNDGKINNYDQTYDHKYYSPTPELIYGFGINMEYKGFYAGCFFQGAGKTSLNLNGAYFIPFGGGLDESSARMEALDHWKATEPDNHNVLFPRLHPANYSHNSKPSDWWYRDARFIRLKNVEFGYDFSKRLINKAFMKSLRLYVQGNNVAIWDKVKFWDPEMGGEYSGAKYPITGSWTVGLEVTF